MKTRKFNVGERVLFESKTTQIRGYSRDDHELYIMEAKQGWEGWCALLGDDIESGHQVIGNMQYKLVYESELSKLN